MRSVARVPAPGVLSTTSVPPHSASTRALTFAMPTCSRPSSRAASGSKPTPSSATVTTNASGSSAEATRTRPPSSRFVTPWRTAFSASACSDRGGSENAVARTSNSTRSRFPNRFCSSARYVRACRSSRSNGMGARLVSEAMFSRRYAEKSVTMRAASAGSLRHISRMAVSVLYRKCGCIWLSMMSARASASSCSRRARSALRSDWMLMKMMSSANVMAAFRSATPNNATCTALATIGSRR